MTKRILLRILISMLLLFFLYHLSNFIINTKEKFVLPINISKINDIYNVSISSDFDYYIGNTALYKDKEIIFYNFDKLHVVTIIKNSHPLDKGIENNKIYPFTLKELLSPFKINKLQCKKLSSNYQLHKKGFNVNIFSKKYNIKLTFLKDNIFIKEKMKGYNSLFQKEITIIRNFKCNFNIYIHNDFILKLKKISYN